MRNLKLYEDYDSPPDYEDDFDRISPEPQEMGRDVMYPESQQLYTPVFTLDEEPGDVMVNGRKRGGNGQVDFDIVKDKTPEQAIWLVEVIEDAIPDNYKVLYLTSEGEEHVQDTEAILNFATDEFKAGRYREGIEAWQDTLNDYSIKERICLVKLVTPEDVDFILEDLYDYLRPGHASYVAKQRAPLRPGLNSSMRLRDEEVARVKRAITILLRYKKQIESNTVGGFNKD
jgi:hypothetical protein